MKINEEIIEEIFKIKVENIKITKLTGGYLSDVLKVEIEPTNKETKKFSCIFKFQPYECQEFKLLIREATFYKIINEFPKTLKVPYCHHTKIDYETGEGFIVIEDLSPCHLKDLKEGLTLDQINKILIEIQKVHVTFWGLTEEVSFLKELKEYKLEQNYNIMIDFSKNYLNHEKLLLNETTHDNLRSFLNQENLIEKIKNKASQKPKTFLHADLWMNNILFKDEIPYLIDFQFFTKGFPLIDISFLLFSSMKVEMFEKEYDCIVKYYYDNLIDSKNKNGEKIKSYEYEQFLEDMKFSNILGSLIMLASTDSLISVYDRVIFSIEYCFKNKISFD
jgi:hypothetical protein